MPRCPSCFTAMTRVEDEGLKWAACGNCFGVWIGGTALTRRVRMDVAARQAGTRAGAEEASLADLAEVVAASNTTKVLRCTACEKMMLKDRIHPMIPVQMDRCKPCNMVWLDAGEMALIRRLYAELMTSDDPELLRRREKVGMVMAQWDQRHADAQDNAMAAASDAGSAAEIGFDLLGHLIRAAM